MFNKFNLKELFTIILTSEIIGIISFMLSGASLESYNMLPRPPFSPDYWFFISIWVVIFGVTGFAFYIVMLNKNDDQPPAIAAYFFWLITAFVWNILFFGFGMYFISFICIIFQMFVLFYTAKCFYRLSDFASVILLPILLWLLYQTYLNFGIWILSNGNAM